MVRPRFDAARDFVAARSLTWFGKDLKAGDPFPKEGVPLHKLKVLYSSRALNMDDGTRPAADEASPVTVTNTGGSWYEVNAPWLEEPEKVQGKAKAEARAAELRDAGEPDYHHGVRLEQGENGWWSVQADWMGDNAYNVHGEEAAREQAAKLRAEGPPPDPRTDVTVDPGLVMGEAEGEFVVNAPWLEEPEIYADREDADLRAAQLREAGPPEGWEPAPEAG